MTTPDLQFAAITDSKGFESLREQWDSLHARLDQPHFFFSFEWCWSVWKYFAERRGYKLHIVTGRLDGRLVIVWPLVQDNRVFRMLSSETLEYRDIFVEASDHAAEWVHQAWSYVLASTHAAAFLFMNLRQPAALSGELARVTNARRLAGAWCPVISLSRFANWDEYASTLPKSLVSDQRRQWKRVHKVLPELSFRVIDRREMIQPIVDWISRHKMAWAETRKNKNIWFQDRNRREAIIAVAESLMDNGVFVLAVLSDGDKLISAGWGYRCGVEFMFHSFAYDIEYASYSPSRLFLERLIQFCFKKGVRIFDFMPGEEAYKRIWATDFIPTESYIVPIGWRGSLLLRFAKVKSKESKSIVAIRRLYQLLPNRIRNAIQGRRRTLGMVDYAVSREEGSQPSIGIRAKRQ